MFLGSHLDGLIGQQHRDAVIDAIGLVQSRVVQNVVDVQQRPMVNRAHQDVEKLRIQHSGGYGVVGRMIGGAAAAG